jgi:cytochrome c oxidase assembly protein subunit 15
MPRLHAAGGVLSHREAIDASIASNVVPTLRRFFMEHRFANVVAGATFLLLVIGGTVNPTGSSLACPEPTFVCHGELFPKMVGGVFYEHGHRLAAMTVGLLQIALTFLLMRRGHRWLGALLLGAVILQGLLGAITVKYKLPWYVSTAHLMLAMSYFGALVWTSFRLRPAPTVVTLDQHERRVGELGCARTWIKFALGAVMIQLLLGALVRHLGAAMVCLGMPTCTIGSAAGGPGEWWPEAGVQQLHMIHRAFGVVVAIVTTTAAVQVWRRAKSWPNLRVLAVLAPVLVVGQVVLGIYTVMTMRSVPVAVAHFAGAASLWALWLSAWCMTRTRKTTNIDAGVGESVP